VTQRGMKRHVYVRGQKIPVKSGRMETTVGLAFKRTKSDRRPVRRRIVLRRNLKGAKRLSVLVHEMIHQLDIGLAERTVLRLEDGIVQMVEENPELFYELAHRILDAADPAQD